MWFFILPSSSWPLSCLPLSFSSRIQCLALGDCNSKISTRKLETSLSSFTWDPSLLLPSGFRGVTCFGNSGAWHPAPLHPCAMSEPLWVHCTPVGVRTASSLIHIFKNEKFLLTTCTLVVFCINSL